MEYGFTQKLFGYFYHMKFSGNGESTPYDIILNMFPNANQDYVISMGENDVVLVREFKSSSPEIDRKSVV